MDYKVTQYNLQFNKGKDSARVEAFYGPWESVEDFVTSDPGKQVLKCEDVVTIGVWDENMELVTEYWNPDGSNNFVVKSAIDMDALKEELKKTFVYVEDAGDSDETVDTSDYATKDYVDTKDESLYKLINDCLAENIQLKLSCEDIKFVTLKHDIGLSETLLVSKGEKTLELNGKSIANVNGDNYIKYLENGKSVTSNVDAITVTTGATLTINGNGHITTVSGAGSTLYANGGTIIVNGGVYESLKGLASGGGYSLVFADKTGKVEINDGYFIVNGQPDESKYQYILNAKDPDTEATITVKGGWYYNWSPANHDNNGHSEVIIPEGYTVEKIENTTFYGAPVGTWYHVVKTEQTEA